jgi:hypothetical protein
MAIIDDDDAAMSFSGVIVKVEQDDSILIISEDDSSHLRIIKVIDNGTRLLRGLIGCAVWSDDLHFMFKDHQIGERISYNQVRLFDKVHSS